MTQPIEKILIANRGEIACRVIRTARERGIATVAVYSDADRRALHVLQADEAVHIGGSASNESYLVIENIIEAVRASGADAVHPGFGFLSENAAFATALLEAGIRFIGPGVHAIEAMGDKITSKKLAEEAGVNVVPGHPDAVPDADTAYEIAEQVGCPVMLKASAGGGGKGMRVAATMDEVREGFTSAQNEARGAFGDDRVFVEKFIEQPRHIEIQIIADAHGHVVYLGERECSIQRRHQKVIEEAPSSFISDTTRRAMGEQAVALAKAVSYQSAGTVEFIVDKAENFYFLEMNTRLQVEHPVTELITGTDIVSLMIDVAEGRELPFGQSEVQIDGWAFEARVYAEDVDRGFLPSTGRIVSYTPPVDQAGVRVDTGIAEGGEISMFYDPMIAKLITWAPTRSAAIERMQGALDSFTIEGVQHNLPFLSALFDHPALMAGDLTTRFIEDHFSDGFNSRQYESPVLAVLPRVAAWLEQRCRERDRYVRPQATPVVGTDTLALSVICGDDTTEVDAASLAGIESHWLPGQQRFEGRIDGEDCTIGVKRIAVGWQLSSRGSVRDYRVMDTRIAELLRWLPAMDAGDQSGRLLSPMPGLLVTLRVKEGDRVVAGQEVAVIEAMKMENSLRAEADGTVKHIAVTQGASLAVDDMIMEFE